jgi:hypothetical protein
VVVHRVFLAGPDRNDREPFDQAAAVLRDHLWQVATTSYGDLPAETTRWDLFRLLRADMLVFLPGWRQSHACGLPARVANAVGCPVYELVWQQLVCADHDWCVRFKPDGDAPDLAEPFGRKPVRFPSWTRKPVQFPSWTREHAG